jgi:hypothetical protein
MRFAFAGSPSAASAPSPVCPKVPSRLMTCAQRVGAGRAKMMMTQYAVNASQNACRRPGATGRDRNANTRPHRPTRPSAAQKGASRQSRSNKSGSFRDRKKARSGPMRPDARPQTPEMRPHSADRRSPRCSRAGARTRRRGLTWSAITVPSVHNHRQHDNGREPVQRDETQP